jgi:hypothetical protein
MQGVTGRRKPAVALNRRRRERPRAPMWQKKTRPGMQRSGLPLRIVRGDRTRTHASTQHILRHHVSPLAYADRIDRRRERSEPVVGRPPGATHEMACQNVTSPEPI